MSTAAEATLPLVRDSVRNVLTRSAAYRALPPADRTQLAHDMVKVARYIVDAGGETAGTPMNAIVATGLADPPPRSDRDRVDDLRRDRKLATDEMAGGANAARQGVDAFGNAINKANFPGFVSGLVEGVFNAIVTSSIRQMEAYGALVANIAKSVDEYMRDNVSENQARDYLADKYPKSMKVDTKAPGGPKLVPVGGRGAHGGRGAGAGGRGGRGAGAGGSGGRGGGQLGLESEAFAGPVPADPMPDFMKDLGLPQPVTRLDDKTLEGTLVPAARRRIAMDRQQLLATMVLMGINRLIVTDGKIAASCLFELNTTDAITEDSEDAASFDEHTTTSQRSWGLWFAPRTRKRTESNFSVSTTNTSSSESSIELHAQLAGNVDINFRSETFPLEKMADLIQIKEIEQKAPAMAPAPPPGPAMPGMQLPPLPPLPAFSGAPAGGAPATSAPAAGDG